MIVCTVSFNGCPLSYQRMDFLPPTFIRPPEGETSAIVVCRAFLFLHRIARSLLALRLQTAESVSIGSGRLDGMGRREVSDSRDRCSAHRHSHGERGSAFLLVLLLSRIL